MNNKFCNNKIENSKKYLPLISQWMFCPFLRALVMPRLYWTTTLADLESTYTSTYASKCTACCWSDLSGSIKRAQYHLPFFFLFFSVVLLSGHLCQNISLKNHELSSRLDVYSLACTLGHLKWNELNWLELCSFRLRRRETTMCFMSCWLGWTSGTSRIFTCKELKRTSTSTR